MSIATKAHQVYKLDGKRVAGVTTVIGILNKPALVHAAWKLGTEGLDYRKVWGQAADIGTLAHYLIQCELKGEVPDTSEYSQVVIDKAETAYLAFLDLYTKRGWVPVLHEGALAVEVSLVSRLGFGGTFDLVAMQNDDMRVLSDWKTSKPSKSSPSGLYPEHKYQLAAYKILWEEHHPEQPIDRMGIGILNKLTGDHSFHEFKSLKREEEIFLTCLRLYKLLKGGK